VDDVTGGARIRGKVDGSESRIIQIATRYTQSEALEVKGLPV
jgi:hypothetical protein